MAAPRLPCSALKPRPIVQSGVRHDDIVNKKFGGGAHVAVALLAALRMRACGSRVRVVRPVGVARRTRTRSRRAAPSRDRGGSGLAAALSRGWWEESSQSAAWRRPAVPSEACQWAVQQSCRNTGRNQLSHAGLRATPAAARAACGASRAESRAPRQRTCRTATPRLPGAGLLPRCHASSLLRNAWFQDAHERAPSAAQPMATTVRVVRQ